MALKANVGKLLLVCVYTRPGREALTGQMEVFSSPSAQEGEKNPNNCQLLHFYVFSLVQCVGASGLAALAIR